jgi:hypothetical protein
MASSREEARAGGIAMNIIRDEFGHNFSELFGKIHEVSPNLEEFEKRLIILPPLLGDLEKPEFIDGLRMKIQEIENLDKKFNEGSLSRDGYCAEVKKILSRP